MGKQHIEVVHRQSSGIFNNQVCTPYRESEKLMKSLTKLGIIALAISGSAYHSGADAQLLHGYVRDSSGTVVKSGHGLCWRVGYWTPAHAIAECDPDLVPKPAAAPAPAAARAATPAPAVVPPAAPKPAAVTAPPAPARVVAAPRPCDAALALESDQSFAFAKAERL